MGVGGYLILGPFSRDYGIFWTLQQLDVEASYLTCELIFLLAKARCSFTYIISAVMKSLTEIVRYEIQYNYVCVASSCMTA